MTDQTMRARLATERGAILIQVATALLVFTMCSAFIVDYGAQLVARNQAQNAADAAALAAATAIAYDEYTPQGQLRDVATNQAALTAAAVASKNLIWSDAAQLDIDPNVVCADTYDAGPSADPITSCLEVRASRTAAKGNAIPALIGQLMGVTTFGVSAHAIGEARDANATGCLRPLAIPDRWTERTGSWQPSSTFDRWDPMDPTMLLPFANRDVYTAPDQLGAGTGLTLSDANWGFATQVTLVPGSLSSPIATISPWQYLPLQIPGSRWGANDVRANTAACAASPANPLLGRVRIDDTLNFAPGGVAANAPLIADGFNEVIAQDLNAQWDPATRRVVNSCADLPVGRCAALSPRIVPVALYSPRDLADGSNQPGGASSVHVTNIAGFFVEGVAMPGTCPTCITGRVVRHPGLRDSTAITLFDDSSFLRATMLVR